MKNKFKILLALFGLLLASKALATTVLFYDASGYVGYAIIDDGSNAVVIVHLDRQPH